MTDYRYGVSFEGDDNVLKWIVAMIAQLCIHTNKSMIYILNK